MHSTTIHIGHPPRGRKPAPYGLPERLRDAALCSLLGMFIAGCVNSSHLWTT